MSTKRGYKGTKRVKLTDEAKAFDTAKKRMTSNEFTALADAALKLRKRKK